VDELSGVWQGGQRVVGLVGARNWCGRAGPFIHGNTRPEVERRGRSCGALLLRLVCASAGLLVLGPEEWERRAVRAGECARGIHFVARVFCAHFDTRSTGAHFSANTRPAACGHRFGPQCALLLRSWLPIGLLPIGLLPFTVACCCCRNLGTSGPARTHTGPPLGQLLHGVHAARPTVSLTSPSCIGARTSTAPAPHTGRLSLPRPPASGH